MTHCCWPDISVTPIIAVWHNISVEHFPLIRILISVKSLRTLLTLLLVALWPLATSHCNLEQVSGFAFLACGDEVTATPAHRDNDCETDSCASVESALYKTEEAQQVVPTPPLVPSELLTTTPPATEKPAAAGKLSSAKTPPELPKAWQFSFRTALAPRDPSFVS